MADQPIDFRAHQRRRNPNQATERPNRAEADRARRAVDYRLRSGLLRGRGTPPTPEYRKARAALDTARAERHQPEKRTNP